MPSGDRPPLLMVQDLGFAVGDDGSMTPTAVIDVSEAPEVADLSRVHAVEGMGDLRTTARRIEGGGPDGSSVLLLGVSLTVPVRAAFAVAFPLPLADGFLREAAGAGRLAFATTDPDRVLSDRPVWLAIDLDGQALTTALDLPD